MCVVCAIGWPGAKGVAGGQRATAIWGNMRESWLTYADYSQHCPQVIIKCLPRVIYIYDYTRQQHFERMGQIQGWTVASSQPRGVAAFNTIIEFL